MHKLKSNIKTVTAFAPATCANVAVGFDILGFAIDNIGDEVSLSLRDDNQIIIEQIESEDNLPLNPKKNTATAVIQKLCSDLKIERGFSVRVRKGIPLSSGMGGSAASAVAALVAFNEFLEKPLTSHELAPYALYGEKVACGAAHADNIMPCLFGGLVLTHSVDPLTVISLPIPDCLCVLIHPHMQISTKHARSVLKDELPLKQYIRQSANLATFIVALFRNDISLLQRSFEDVLIEPQRAKLIPRFNEIKAATLAAGALGMSLSGSGPTLFALVETKETAQIISEIIRNEFLQADIQIDSYISKISQNPARVIHVN